ncbi:MAG TPA: hypothetical protein VFE58_09925 [Tepidisphaeraceae bacterium]|jgi:hypothetical protein|nr:hypothetical protein [Tepidisphaeraceae bacterium]
MLHNPESSHSSDVKMRLDCGEHGRIELSRITPNSVVARHASDLLPCHADLVVVVDGEMMRNRVNIANGFSKPRRTALALPIDQIAPF